MKTNTPTSTTEQAANTNPPHIGPENPAACLSCKHVRDPNSKFPDCVGAPRLMQFLNIYTGDYRARCVDMRDDPALCGPAGSRFTAKPETPARAQPAVIVYGPPGCGKTTNAAALATFFGKKNVHDEWRPGIALDDDSLALTSIENVLGAIGFDDAMRDAGLVNSSGSSSLQEV